MRNDFCLSDESEIGFSVGHTVLRDLNGSHAYQVLRVRPYQIFFSIIPINILILSDSISGTGTHTVWFPELNLDPC